MALSLAACSSSDIAESASEESLVNSIELISTANKPTSLAEFDGPLVVNFYAEWCPACQIELPDFAEVSVARTDVTFVGINQDPDFDKWLIYEDEINLPYETFMDMESEMHSAVGALSMPATAFIVDGVVTDIHSGVLTKEGLNQFIDENLA